MSAQSAERFAERVRARRRVTLRKALIGSAVLVVVAALGWIVLFSPVLAVDREQITVTGAGTVVAAADIDAVVADAVGVPMVRLNTRDLRARLLEVPGVRDATVVRDWPRGLTVTLVAREPVAAVPIDGGVLQLLDIDGVPVGQTQTAPDGLPTVTIPVGDDAVLTTVLDVIAGLPADLAAQIQDVSATTQDAVHFTLRDGAAVEWGNAEQGDLKAAVLHTLRSAPVSAGSKVFDVSAPLIPITR